MAEINSTGLPCPRCRHALPWHTYNTLPAACPSCKERIYAAVFPALFRPPEKGQAGEAVLTNEEASCYYHPDKKASIACEACGRFLCALCDVSLAGQHLCTACVETGKRKGHLPKIHPNHVLYDEIALSLALLPLLVWPFTLITAPAAVWMCFRHWKTPLSIVPRTKIRFWLALLFATLQIAAWIIFFVFLIRG